MMTVAEPYVNVMRAALAAFAAGLGGADSVTLLPFSQAIGLPDAFARRLARNTQLIELREARLGFVADPAAGAGGFEAMTDGLCEKAWALFQSFEAAGGLAAALERGIVQDAVKIAAEALKRDVARGKTLLTGVSAHPHLDADRVAVLPDLAKASAAADGRARAASSVRAFRAATRGGQVRAEDVSGGDRAAIGAYAAARLRARVFRGRRGGDNRRRGRYIGCGAGGGICWQWGRDRVSLRDRRRLCGGMRRPSPPR